MAVTVSLVMMAISIFALFIQRRILSRRRYASALTNRPVIKQLSGLPNVMMHLYCYLVALIAMSPTFVVIYTSFLETSGPVFTGDYGLNSYRRVLADAPEAILNSFKFSLMAVALIAVASGLISYIIVRRDNMVSGAIDVMMMVPYLVPGVVLAIGYVTTFRTEWFNLTGTWMVIVMIFFIRRLPYGVRSTTTSIRQIKPSMEEAAINLGASPLKAYVTITLPLILPGLIVGSLMSFITAINELS